MKKIFILLTVLFLMGCSEDAVTQPNEDEVPVRIATSKVEIVEETYVTIGEIISEYSNDIYLPQGSTITKLFVEEGDMVDSGDQLLSYMDTLGNMDTLMSNHIGQVSEVAVRPGSSARLEPVMRIVDPAVPAVKSMLSSELTKKLSVGTPVELKFEDETIIPGKVSYVSVEADPLSRLYETRVTFDYDEVLLGEFVELTFVMDSYEAVLVPSMAIVRKNGEKYIYQYIDDQLIKMNVETGLSSGEWIELIGVDKMQFDYVISGQNFVSLEDKIVVLE
jgi:multidrug efflux pump subunit AcrA (membrane-fusion protein)